MVWDNPVHPRGRGEQLQGRLAKRHGNGSSPRARGTDQVGNGVMAGTRFIPAGAGNSLGNGVYRVALTVHPRGRGEQLITHITNHDSNGSSPRARGTGIMNPLIAGKVRFIPAGAGNRTQTPGVRGVPPVHPRGRGEQGLMSIITVGGHGSSPRARGTAPTTAWHSPPPRFIPAGAGNRAASLSSRWISSVHPRGRGEQLLPVTRRYWQGGSSPRARGTAVVDAPLQRLSRFIPAGAGNRSCQSGWRMVSPVHPRGRGEQT